ncbi:MAG: VOC family protein [Micromonosporaceae bacterium]
MTFDSTDPEADAAFWCAALGYRVTDRDHTGVAIAGDSTAPTILLVRSTEPKRGKTPIHFDLCPTDRDQASEVERLLGLGAPPRRPGHVPKMDGVPVRFATSAGPGPSLMWLNDDAVAGLGAG